MTTEQYKERLNELKKVIENTRSKITELDIEYIESNRTVSDGDKVLINGKHIAFIRKAKIGYDDEVSYDFLKVKKDGSPSSIREYVWKVITIEKLES